MAITSENKPKSVRYIGTQFRYALLYVIITFAVLLFLNIYSSKISQELFYKSKETSMIEKCQLTASEISALEVLNPSTAAAAITQMANLNVTRLLITDQNGIALFDSEETDSKIGEAVEYSEVATALENCDVFAWNYQDGAMQSRAATPIYAYGTLIGCVYIMEFDAEQGALIQSLQNNILAITLFLEAAVILFSLVFFLAFSRRLRKIMASMRIIREGDYSHRVKMGGHDELTALGNEFNDLTERLQTSEQKRRQFVSDASHELKTPLASIKLLSDSILQNEMDIETVREFVGDIGNEADRLNRMAQKLLSLTRTELPEENPDCEIILIAPTVEKVIRMLSIIADNNNITIQTNLKDDCPILIQEDDLYQIIFNLIENGIKYNTPGGTLTVTLRRQEDNAYLCLEDTGVGIPEDALEHIFERFYRVDKARSRKSGGSGLGLSIVRNMVNRNRGEIYVESTVGKGTAFTVVFPAFDTES